MICKDLVMGIDPGRRVSGMVVLSLTPTVSVRRAARLPNDHVCNLLWALPLVSVSMEGFRLYPWVAMDKRWDDLLEVKMIGRVEEICRVRQIQLDVAFPSEIKRVIEDPILRLLGTWSRNPHVMDAFRVFWYTSL